MRRADQLSAYATRAGAIPIATTLCALLSACGGATPRTATPADAYAQVCANCHLENGKGMPPAYRSLVGSAWVTGSVDRAVAIVLFGVQGPVVEGGTTYPTSMMPYGSGAAMSDSAVAAAVSHARTSWGNAASAVSAEEVARVRGRFSGRTKGFTQTELNGWSDPR